ncbi:hypothetical protein F4779DRAFT_606862 [Xylariaceae sp. FL0662B]|nr:hypothetical protein F4779DRAFT_606862 [Xylariaceae sp. FL0662B]
MMQIQTAIALFSLSALATSDVDANDVPSVCVPACQVTIDLTARCDQQTDDDNAYRSCVCDTQDFQARITECATCVKDNGTGDAYDNDVAELMSDCGWNFNDANASYTSGTAGVATSTGQTTPTVITSSSGGSVFTTTQTSTGAAGAESTNSVSTGGAPAVTGGVRALFAGGLAFGLRALV